METTTPRLPSAEHPITISPTGAQVVVRLPGGQTVASSSKALTLREADYPPVQYVPVGDVDMTLLRSTTTSTHCPYKGNASYYSIEGPEAEIQDAVWTYEQPYPAMAAIAGHLAFYPDKVQITIGDPE
jgi:uncharacterized protein (DUF427 family)